MTSTQNLISYGRIRMVLKVDVPGKTICHRTQFNQSLFLIWTNTFHISEQNVSREDSMLYSKNVNGPQVKRYSESSFKLGFCMMRGKTTWSQYRKTKPTWFTSEFMGMLPMIFCMHMPHSLIQHFMIYDKYKLYFNRYTQQCIPTCKKHLQVVL